MEINRRSAPQGQNDGSVTPWQLRKVLAILVPDEAATSQGGYRLPLSKYFRLEALTLIAFLATIPIYSPNHLLFETGVFDVPTFMAPFANTMLFSTLVLGTLAALASGRRCPERLLGRGWVVAGVAAYCYGLRPAHSRGGAAGRRHGGCGGSFGFSVGGGHRGAGGAVGQLHGRLRPAPGAFVVRPFRGLRGARGASAVLHHLRRGAHRVRGAGAGELPRALPGGVEAPAGRRAPGRSGRRGQGGWCGIVRAGGGGISGPHAPGAAGVFGLGVRHAAGGPHGVRLHDGGAEASSCSTW